MGAGDVMATVTGPAKLTDMNELTGINGFGMSTCGADAELADVVMLTSHLPNSSTRQFMKYIKNAHDVNSILLKCLPLKDASVQSALESASITVDLCECNCNCIVLWTVESITPELLRRMPVTLEKLSDALCLLPCQLCRVNGCHGCNQGLLQHTTRWGLRQRSRLTGGDPEVELPPAVCEALGFEFTTHILEKPICICFPVNDAPNDDWTKLLMRSFKSKDQEDRGAIVMASDALENYLAESRENRTEEVFYRTASLVVPRLTEALINIVLTVFFTVDGFSSSLLARRTIKDYIVDSKGSGFAANAFLTEAVVMSDADNSCQLLTFRGDLLGFRTVSFIGGFVNMLCSIVWAVLIAFDGGPDTSPPPSIPTLALIMAAIGISFCMGLAMLLPFFLSEDWKSYFGLVIIILCPWVMFTRFPCNFGVIYAFLFFAMMHLEMICFVSGSIVARTMGVKAFGKWIYAALQILVLFNWGIGSLTLDFGQSFNISGEFLGRTPPTWLSLPYSSAFLLNAVLAGVRSKWGPWLWKDNHLWSRKLLH